MTAMPQAVDALETAQEADSLRSPAVPAIAYVANAREQQIVWRLPEEVPVALQFNSEPYTVMMATPADLRDFAVGLSIGEGLIRDAAAIQGILVMPVAGGLTVDIAIAEQDLNRDRMAPRAIEGRSGCGLCGVTDIASANRALTPLHRDRAPAPDAIRCALSTLKGHQPMNRLNRSVHAAAFADWSGTILLAREDVGRHNALDKLIGAMAREKIDASQGFAVMTSRCSYELVQKAVTAGLPALVTVSAPTTLAHELAVKSNLYLAALGPDDAIVQFNP
jgi:FdhD protein